MSTFRNTLSVQSSSYLPAYEDGTKCYETSAYKIQTPGNYPEESIQHSEHGESLKTKMPCHLTKAATQSVMYGIKILNVLVEKISSDSISTVTTSKEETIRIIRNNCNLPNCRLRTMYRKSWVQFSINNNELRINPDSGHCATFSAVEVH
jgi:hypothetical protein